MQLRVKRCRGGRGACVAFYGCDAKGLVWDNPRLRAHSGEAQGGCRQSSKGNYELHVMKFCCSVRLWIVCDCERFSQEVCLERSFLEKVGGEETFWGQILI